ncbi:hypothetical protein, partial [Chitinophaga hostae]|uniref:hypothetical protein n=1 Tax=Chitinophaga hostae TaxID=2831022 RepID=UPI003F6A32BE
AACCGSPSLGPSAALQGLRSGCRRSGRGWKGGGGGRTPIKREIIALIDSTLIKRPTGESGARTPAFVL